MSFVETTQKMAYEVAAEAHDVDIRAHTMWCGTRDPNLEYLALQMRDLAHAVEKLARCVARRFPEQGTVPGEAAKQVTALAGALKKMNLPGDGVWGVQRGAPSERADGGVCRDCGGMTVPTGTCSTCSACGSTGGCG